MDAGLGLIYWESEALYIATYRTKREKKRGIPVQRLYIGLESAIDILPNDA